MSIYSDSTENSADSDGENTMAVLNTLGGGGEDPLAEGEPLGLDPDAGKSKLSGSSLAVGVVVVLGACALFGMKLTLKAIAAGESPTDAIAEIDTFITNMNAANKAGVDGPIKPKDEESQKILDELQQDPTAGQVPAEEVEGNPFDLSGIVEKPVGPTTTPAGGPDPRQQAVDRALRAAKQIKVDSISGNIVFLNGEMYRIGDAIAKTGFVLEKVEGLTCVIRTTDEFKIPIRLEYR